MGEGMDFQALKKSVKLSFSTACFLAYTVLVLMRHSPEFVPSNTLWIVFAAVAALAGLLICAFCADGLEAWGPTKLMVVASLTSFFGFLVFEYRPHVVVAVLGLCCLVTGFVLFVMLLGKNLAVTENVDRLPFLATAVVVCGLFIAISIGLAEWAKPLFIACLPLLTMAHMYVVSRERDDNDYEFMGLAESRETFSLKKHALATTGITGMVWGIAFALLARSNGEAFLGIEGFPLSSCLIAIAFVLGGSLFLVFARPRNGISEYMLLRSFALFAFIGIAPLPFVAEQTYPWFGFYLLLVFTFSNIVCYSAISELARFMQMSPYWVWGISLFWYLVGSIIGFLAIDYAIDAGALAITSFVLLLIIIAGRSFVFADNYPMEESDPIEIGVAISQAEHEPTIWRKKLDKVASDFGLTARQVEVFRLLVRGRNAQHIAEQFVISNSTAKAHIHNIYQKLDIHSQQELIDLVENADIDE